MFHWAMFRATRLPMALRDKLHEKLQCNSALTNRDFNVLDSSVNQTVPVFECVGTSLVGSMMRKSIALEIDSLLCWN